MNNLTAIVTGGTRGIGLAIAKSLAKRGAAVAVTYNSNEQDADEARRQLIALSNSETAILALKGDAGHSPTVSEQHEIIYRKIGAVNILINNAGIMPTRSFDDITADEWNETIRINLNSAFYWCRTVVPNMKKSKFGRIVNISSIAARELGKYGITVNAIAPAFIEDAGIFTAWSDGRKAPLKEKIHVSRLGSTHDVVRAFEYLLESPFVTGVTLDVNGGAFMI